MTTLYFATNRNPNNKKKPTSFGGRFSEQNLGDLRFGRAEVTGNKLVANSVEVLPDAPAKGSEQMFKDLRAAMKVDQCDSLVFIHGFNVSFEESLLSAAKMGSFFTAQSPGFTPNIFVFSWPSDGKLTNYSNDRHDAEASGYAFARGLLKLSTFLRETKPADACQRKINLIAHSMGNYVLRHALQQTRKIAGALPLPRIFDEIILTAADEDADAFEHDHKLAKLPDVAQRVTVYFNSGDLALVVSDATKGNPDRLGHDGARKPHELPGKVVLVEASDVIKDDSHSYHLDSPRVAKDMTAVLQGESSESGKLKRVYVPHANKFRLT